MLGAIKKILFINISISFCLYLNSQTVYVNISNRNIYDFLDELANEKIILLNSTIKPYSRKYILKKLEEAYKEDELLNIRQLEELEFYLNEYGFDVDVNENPVSDRKSVV